MVHLPGNVLLDKTATIGRNCQIGPDVVIGPDCVIEDGKLEINTELIFLESH